MKNKYVNFSLILPKKEELLTELNLMIKNVNSLNGDKIELEKNELIALLLIFGNILEKNIILTHKPLKKTERLRLN